MTSGRIQSNHRAHKNRPCLAFHEAGATNIYWITES